MSRPPRSLLYGALGGLTVALQLFFLAPYLVGGYRTPIGFDASAYQWWANLSRIDGLSVANGRPGIVALQLMTGGVLGLSQEAVVAVLGAVLATCIGLSAFALVRADRPDLPPWVPLMAGLLGGTWSAYLVNGYLSNLAFVMGLMTAIALLCGGAGPTEAALALGAGALSHPLFLLPTLVILLGAAALTQGVIRRKILLASGGAVAATGIGILLMIPGAQAVKADSSADAFLRRVGWSDVLYEQFRGRLRNWTWFAPWTMLPLSFLGRNEPDAAGRSLLKSWSIVCLAGGVIAAIWPRVPSARWVAFAFALPVLAAVGMWRLRRRIPGRVVAWSLIGLLTIITLWGPVQALRHAQPHTTPIGIASIRRAGDELNGVAVGTPLVFLVRGNAVEVTNLGNMIRAYLPPERIRDVHLYVGDAEAFAQGRPTLSGDREEDALSQLYMADLRAAGVDPGTAWVSEVPYADPGPSPSGLDLAGTGAFCLLLLTLVGGGWAWWLAGDAVSAVALSPALGGVGLILAGITSDRLGLRLEGAVPAAGAAVLAAAGYLVAGVRGSRLRRA